VLVAGEETDEGLGTAAAVAHTQSSQREIESTEHAGDGES
jgi:hypothetical protein